MESNNTRANRSDIHLSREEEAKIEAQTRDYFDGIVPKRHTKPQRSEYSSQYVDALAQSTTTNDGVIPEFAEFQILENDQRKLVYRGSKVEEEFVETEYYKDLNSVDKQHHTTGTGFIRMENTTSSDNDILLSQSDSLTASHHSSKSNPATNDWTPLSLPHNNNDIHVASGKPNRSDT